MHQATFRIEHDGGYSEATAGTDTTVEMWCNDHCDLLHVRGEKTESVVEGVEPLVGVRDRIETHKDTVVITRECLRERDHANVESYLIENDCLLLPPLRYADGAKFCRVLALDETNLTSFYRDIIDDFDVSVKSKHEIETVTGEEEPPIRESTVSELSERQGEALRTALDAGYYEIPRETTTEEIAEKMGVGRRTAEEHLRRAEKKIVESFSDSLF